MARFRSFFFSGIEPPPQAGIETPSRRCLGRDSGVCSLPRVDYIGAVATPPPPPPHPSRGVAVSPVTARVMLRFGSLLFFGIEPPPFAGIETPCCRWCISRDSGVYSYSLDEWRHGEELGGGNAFAFATEREVS